LREINRIRKLEDLEVFRDARGIVRRVYDLVVTTKTAHRYPLRDQLLRASLSVVSNIAEGFERDGDREFLQFLSQAKGSCGELRAQLRVAEDLAFVSEQVVQPLIEDAMRLSRRLARLMD